MALRLVTQKTSPHHAGMRRQGDVASKRDAKSLHDDQRTVPVTTLGAVSELSTHIAGNLGAAIPAIDVALHVPLTARDGLELLVVQLDALG